MKTFVDNAQRTWTLSINVGAIKRVRALCNVNLLDIITLEADNKPNTGLLEQLSGDPVLLVDVLFAICKPEADAKSITDEDFGCAMSGDAIEFATRALLEELGDIVPEVKRRVFQKILTATRRFEEETTKKLQELMDSGEIDKAIDKELKKLNG